MTVRGQAGAQRARTLGHLLVVTGVFVVCLVFHALPCPTGHAATSEPVAAHEHTPGGHCESHEQPHERDDPACLVVARPAETGGSGSAAPALLLVLLVPAGLGLRCLPGPARGSPRGPFSGQRVLRTLCVLRR